MTSPVRPDSGGAGPTYRRAVGRWQILGLSVNDVVGSGVYLLPAAAALLLGPSAVWAVLLAGAAVGLLVLCYAQAASFFDKPGGSYLYAREAFGDFVGFEVGWMLLLTRLSAAAALSKGLAVAVAPFWAPAAGGWGELLVVIGSLVLLAGINIIGVRSAATTAAVLAVGKLLPLVLFIVIGLHYVDWSLALPEFGSGMLAGIPLRNLGEAALLLLFAYAGFENLAAAAGEYKRPERDVPFALLTMITTVTLLYVLVQLVAQGTLPGLAQSGAPLAEASRQFGGAWLALALTVGAAVSILGTNSNTVMLGPRYLQALAADGFGPRFLAAIHPRFHTPVPAIVAMTAVAIVLALSGSFVQLALLSVVARLCTYLATVLAVMVLQKRHVGRPGTLKLPGGRLIPAAALLVALGLLASATPANLAAAAVALAVGALVYFFKRKEQPA